MNAQAAAERIDVVSDAAALPEAWDARAAGASVTLQRPYLQALESAPPPGTRLRYALAWRGEDLVAIGVFHLVPFAPGQLARIESEGPWPARAFLWLAHHLPLPPAWLLLCGNALHADAPGFASAPQLAQRAELLARMAEHVRAQGAERVALMMLKTPDLGDRAALLEACGYLRVDAVEPTMRLDLDPTWASAEDYLAAMRSKYRQRQRSARKRARSVQREALDAAGVRAHADVMEALLEPILARADVALTPLPAATLVALQDGLGEAFRAWLYRHDGRIVGFAVSIRQPDGLDGFLVAADDDANRGLKLYQNALYDFVDDALDAGVSRLCLGRTALEIKSTLGAEPVDLPVYVRAPGWLLHRLLSVAVPRLSGPSWRQRRPFHHQLEDSDDD